MGSNGRRGWNPYLTFKEAAELLHMSVEEVRDLIKKRKLPCDPVSRSSPRCIPLDDVMEHIEANKL